MTQPISDYEFLSRWLSTISWTITSALGTLLEGKHLYQSVTVGLDKVPADDTRLQHVVLGPWFPEDPLQRDLQPVLPVSRKPGLPGLDIRFTFKAPDVKLFCSGKCSRIEAFNLVFADEFFSRGERRGRPREYGDGKDSHQVFVLSYECQSCKEVPEVFLVRRTGSKLTIAGRAPIEHVDVPKELPRDQKGFFRAAVVAHNSGQTLAGLFLLRTFIEQFARAITGSPDAKADVLMDTYMDQLPGDFKERFASMKSLYGDLSADIHSATGSPDLFDDARKKITEHFEARRLFKL